MHNGRGSVKIRMHRGTKHRQLTQQAEGLLQARNGCDVPRIGAEPLVELPLARGRKAVVALSEPRDRDIFDGGEAGSWLAIRRSVIAHDASSVSGAAASTRPRASKNRAQSRTPLSRWPLTVPIEIPRRPAISLPEHPSR